MFEKRNYPQGHVLTFHKVLWEVFNESGRLPGIRELHSLVFLALNLLSIRDFCDFRTMVIIKWHFGVICFLVANGLFMICKGWFSIRRVYIVWDKKRYSKQKDIAFSLAFLYGRGNMCGLLWAIAGFINFLIVTRIVFTRWYFVWQVVV